MKLNNERNASKSRHALDDNENLDPSQSLPKKMRTSTNSRSQFVSTTDDNNQALTPCNNNNTSVSCDNANSVLLPVDNTTLSSSNDLQSESPSNDNILSSSLPSNNVEISPLLISNMSSTSTNYFTTASARVNDGSSQLSNEKNITLPLTTNNNSGTVPSPSNILNQQPNNSNSTGRKNMSNVWRYATKSEDGKIATCQLCDFTCTTASHSTSSIRYHLIRRHNKLDLIINSVPVAEAKPAISIRFKRELHNLCYNAIVMDHRPFNDFRKKGISLVFQKLCPGYVPPHRNQVSKQLRRMFNHHYQLLKEELKSIDYIGLTLDFWSTRSGISYLCITGHWYGDNADFFSKIIHFASFNERHTAINIANCIKQILMDLEIYEKIISITCDGGENLVAACKKLDSSIKRIWCCAHRLHLVVINALGFWNKQKKVDQNQTTDLTREVPPTTNDVIPKQREEQVHTDISKSAESDVLLYEIEDDISANDAFMVDVTDEDEDEDKDMEDKDEPDQAVDDESSTDTQGVNLIYDNWSTTIDTNVPPLDVVELNMNILKKCRSVATASKKSYIISNFLRSIRSNTTYTAISNDCKSRWNSTFKLVNSIIDNKHSLIKLFLEKRSLKLRKEQFDKLTEIELSNEDWDYLTSLNRVLKPFAGSTVMMSGKNYPAIGLAYHAIQKLKSFCENESENEHIKELKQLLLGKIYKYFYYDSEQLDHFQKHAYFDPSAHLSFNDAEKNQCEKYIKTLILNDIYPQKQLRSDHVQAATSTAVVPTLATTSPQLQHSVPQSTSSKQSAYDDFIAACGEQDFTQETTKEKSKRISLNDEFKFFRLAVQDFNSKNKPSTTSVLKFWKAHYIQLPLLWNLAKVHLVTCATSVASESAFSCSAYIARKERSRLSPDNLAFSLFLKDKLDKE